MRFCLPSLFYLKYTFAPGLRPAQAWQREVFSAPDASLHAWLTFSGEEGRLEEDDSDQPQMSTAVSHGCTCREPDLQALCGLLLQPRRELGLPQVMPARHSEYTDQEKSAYLPRRPLFCRAEAWRRCLYIGFR